MTTLGRRELLKLFGWGAAAAVCCGWTSAAEPESSSGEFSPASTIAASKRPQVIERQTRVFKISVDGTERGNCIMQIRHRDDDTDVVRGTASLDFNYIIYRYRFSSSGMGLWKNGRLVKMQKAANFNGDKYDVRGTATANGLLIDVNGKRSMAPEDAIATSYWHLPEYLTSQQSDLTTADSPGVLPVSGSAERWPNDALPRAVVLIDSDKGRQLKGTLDYVGEENLQAAGELRTCSRYKITGEVDVNLWFDGQRRLVRRHSIESGHKVLLDLTRIEDK